MRHAPSTPLPAHRFRISPAGAIEWEELPSLASRVRGTGGASPPAPAVWDATRPADLDPPVASDPFREPVQGVAVREVTEPDVFRHFFGA